MTFFPWVQTVQAAGTAMAAPYQRSVDSVTDMVINAGPMVKVVLALLLLLSFACWWIIFVKIRYFKKAKGESEQFLAQYRQKGNFPVLYRESRQLEYGYLPQLFESGYAEWAKLSKSLESQPRSDSEGVEAWLEGVERAMQGAMLVQRQRMERFLALLATTGSTAPFIGLFGTVWGIMSSFQEIGLKGAANLAVVAPGISEALIATAMGLAAAIPAVVAYNYFSNRIRAAENEMHYFINDFSNLVKREWLRRLAAAKPMVGRRMAAQE